jgi:undecaprenyl-diphosphatase
MIAFVNGLDLAALAFTIALVDAVDPVRGILARIVDLYLVKTALPMTLLWFLWLSPSGRLEEKLGLVASSLAGLVAALAIGRMGQLLLPARLRPISDPDLAPTLPLPGLAELFDGWSSFPSDHATVAGAMIAAAFALSRPAAVLLALWLFFANLLPRLYLGIHWWSDVLAGLALGAGVTWAMISLGPPAWALTRLRRLVTASPALALAGMFLVSFEIASNFDGTRGLAEAAAAATERLSED